MNSKGLLLLTIWSIVMSFTTAQSITDISIRYPIPPNQCGAPKFDWIWSCQTVNNETQSIFPIQVQYADCSNPIRKPGCIRSVI